MPHARLEGFQFFVDAAGRSRFRCASCGGDWSQSSARDHTAAKCAERKRKRADADAAPNAGPAARSTAPAAVSIQAQPTPDCPSLSPVRSDPACKGNATPGAQSEGGDLRRSPSPATDGPDAASPPAGGPLEPTVSGTTTPDSSGRNAASDADSPLRASLPRGVPEAGAPLDNTPAFELTPEEEELIEDFREAECAAAELEHCDAVDVGNDGSTWLSVADCSVCEKLPLGAACTVRQAAFHILHNMTTKSSTFSAAMDTLDFVCYALFDGDPRPDNPNNRMPPSVHVCCVVLGVRDISEFEVHMCPAPEGCLHWFTKPAPVNIAQHAAQCNGCDACRCPEPGCGASRFCKDGGKFVPAAPVYFFHDVFQQYFLNRVWYDRVQAARCAKTAPFYSSTEYKRVRDHLIARGFVEEQVQF